MIYDGLRVLDRSGTLAGAYAAKLLTDLGADTVCVEERDEIGALDVVARAQRDYLRTSQHSVEPDDADDLTRHADVVIAATPMAADGPLVTVTISPFGYGGPDDDLNALPFTDEVLQARSGALMGHGYMTMTPLTVAGRIGEYVGGAFGALGAMTAWRRASRLGRAEHVDVSVLEAMQLTMLTYPTLYATFPGGGPRSYRFVMIPGNEPCADGNYVGLTANTVANWKAILRAADRDDLLTRDDLDTTMGRLMHADESNEILESWTRAHTAAEIEAMCESHRVPVAIVGNGRTLLEFEHLRAREVYVDQPGGSWRRPRAPFRFHGVTARDMTAAPEPGAAPPSWTAPARERPNGTVDSERPLAGVRVLDFTAFWAGPFATAWLAAMGAHVIKVESIQRPDGMRHAGSTIHGQANELEASPVFAASNVDKSGITLDCSRPEGVELAKRLAATCDIVVENFTPRVMEEWGLDYDTLRAVRADVIMVRLPAFGLTGPWRDRPGFAQTMEQLSGMAWSTGYDDGPPIIAGGVVDPMVGAHVALAIVAALEHRAATGEGQLVEMPMVDVAVATTADQVIRYQLTGDVGGRRGAGGVYRAAGDDEWIAVARDHDSLDADARATWCATRTKDDAQRELLARGIPALAAIPGHATLDDPQLRARGFFERLTHAVVGEQDFPTWPVRFSAGPRRFSRHAAPLIGEHNDAVLGGELGLSRDELDRLRKDDIIGEQALGG
jgi:crotonobetainyl-CoA:carnitine CoA-transferase CaiB-like acyl-CoA transferase